MTSKSLSSASKTELTPVPPLNLAANFAGIQDELLAEMTAVATSGMYVLGPKVTAFEEALAAYCGTQHAVAVSSGTDALLVGLMARDVGPGDEVIVPAFTFFATAGVVTRLGATPVFCDIDPVSMNIAIEQCEQLITPRTKAIIPVHLYGLMADVRRIRTLAAPRGIAVIEDAAQAIGACEPGRDGSKAGSIGDYGALSFYPTKNLGALGDAGAVLTNDTHQDALLRKLRIHGSGHTYYHERVGGNFRIDALQAALLNVKLRHLEAWTEQRRARAHRYTELLTEAGLAPEKVRPPQELFGRHVYHQYVIRVPQRDELMAHLRERKIGAAVYYPLPLHLQTCFANLGGKPGDMPNSEKAAAEVLALPIYPELTEAQQRAVVAAIADFYS